MHPALAPHLHPMCESAIRSLENCHASHPIRKFIGACNDAKVILDKCLADEYLVKREMNAEKARRHKERVRKALDEEADLE